MRKSKVDLGRKLNTAKVMLGKSICAAWATRGVETNWGDNLNPYLIRKVSGRHLVHAQDVHSNWTSEIYGVIGSWLGDIRYPNLVVWGLGFIRHDGEITKHPKCIKAVRGPRTLQKLRDAGYATPTAVGDPALMIPLLYTPKAKSKKVVGVIPHHRDRELPIFGELAKRPGYKIIDICTGIEDFCEQLAECEAVVSSSLHAVVAAHAFKVPAQFIKVSDNPLGDGFKLLDYLSSVDLDDRAPIECNTADAIKTAVNSARLPRQYPDMGKLISVCPFMPRTKKRHYIALAEEYYRV
jgi:hypothetical protein